jgi:hypothetical protein
MSDRKRIKGNKMDPKERVQIKSLVSAKQKRSLEVYAARNGTTISDLIRDSVLPLLKKKVVASSADE